MKSPKGHFELLERPTDGGGSALLPIYYDDEKRFQPETEVLLGIANTIIGNATDRDMPVEEVIDEIYNFLDQNTNQDEGLDVVDELNGRSVAINIDETRLTAWGLGQFSAPTSLVREMLEVWRQHRGDES